MDKERDSSDDEAETSRFDRKLVLAIDQLAQSSCRSTKREKKKSSLLSLWASDSVRLFRLLSSQGWEEERPPHLVSFAQSLVRDKKIHWASEMIAQVAAQDSWEGEVIDSGLASFLSGGFRAKDIVHSPSGFSVFMCLPMGHSIGESKAKRIQRMQEVFGSGKLTDESLKECASLSMLIPSSRMEATVQLSVAIRLLDLLTGEQSIAGDGYRFGATLMRRYGRRFEHASTEDPIFLVRYLYMLDCTFQSFCDRLVDSARGSDPLAACLDIHLDRFQKQRIETEMASFINIGAIPTLSLPAVLRARAPTTRGLIALEETDTKTKSPSNAHPRTPPTNTEEPGCHHEVMWHKVNLSMDKNWCLPRKADQTPHHRS